MHAFFKCFGRSEKMAETINLWMGNLFYGSMIFVALVTVHYLLHTW